MRFLFVCFLFLYLLTVVGCLSVLSFSESVSTVSGCEIVSKFGNTQHPTLKDAYFISNGIKLRCPDHSLVKNMAHGIVVFVGHFGSYGRMVIIEHIHSTFCAYGLLTDVYVKVGQIIPKNRIIARLGAGQANILYLEIRKNNVPIDPIPILRRIKVQNRNGVDNFLKIFYRMPLHRPSQ